MKNEAILIVKILGTWMLFWLLIGLVTISSSTDSIRWRINSIALVCVMFGTFIAGIGGIVIIWVAQ